MNSATKSRPLRLDENFDYTLSFFDGFEKLPIDQVAPPPYCQHPPLPHPKPKNSPACDDCLDGIRKWKPKQHRKSKVKPTSFGWIIGYSQGVEVWIHVERPCTVIGPARSGKGTNIVIPAIIGAPGSVLCTSIRVELLFATAICRAARGNNFIFNLDDVGGIAHNLWWDPLEGCHKAKICMERANTMVKGSGLGGDNEVWATAARAYLQALLQAAAVGVRKNPIPCPCGCPIMTSRYSMSDVYEWAQSPDDLAVPSEILRELAASKGKDALVDGWHKFLEHIQGQDPEMKSKEWFGVKNALAPLHSHEVRARLSHSHNDLGGFNTREYLLSTSTIYMLATGATDGSAGGIGVYYSLFLDHLTDTALDLAQKMGGRLDPTHTQVLDEIANVHAWMGVHRMMTRGSGEGIQTVLAFQSYKQIVNAYGADLASTIWSNSLKIALGGDSDDDYLAGLAGLSEDVLWDNTSSSTDNQSWTRKSTTSSKQFRPGLSKADIRELAKGDAMVVERNVKPALTTMIPYWENPHAACIEACEAWHKKHLGYTVKSVITKRDKPLVLAA